jgi:hypothetical protein
MRLIGGVSVNWALSNLHRRAANFSHDMKRDKDVEQECANPILAAYRAALRVGGHLNIIGVECVKNLKILFPAPADIGSDDGGIQDPLPRV